MNSKVWEIICLWGVLFISRIFAQELECKAKLLWDVRGCEGKKKQTGRCKDYPQLIDRTKNFIKGLNSERSRRRIAAAWKFLGVIPLVQRFVKRFIKEPREKRGFLGL
ncbi:MAG: hypothetical protein ACK4NF_03460, partial [Planctomycetota bacterium]